MREEYILISSDGPDSNVLKLKPPLVFSHDNVDHFVKILDRVLTEINDAEVSRNSEL
jgi:ethanolamine-phosphate phospho-lyase